MLLKQFIDLLPKGFVRMHHYGILASKNKAKELNMAKKDLGQLPWEKLKTDWKAVTLEKLKVDITRCPKCKAGLMEIIEVIPKRGPPVFKMTPNFNFLKK